MAASAVLAPVFRAARRALVAAGPWGAQVRSGRGGLEGTPQVPVTLGPGVLLPGSRKCARSIRLGFSGPRAGRPLRAYYPDTGQAVATASRQARS